MISLPFVFTIFFLTLGPVKTIPAFFVLTRDAAPADLRNLALRGTAVATIICLIIALIFSGTMHSWRISVEAMRIAGSILLFAAAMQAIFAFSNPAPAPTPGISDPEKLKGLAIAPLAVPTIVTPWGVAAILMFITLARENTQSTFAVLGILLAVMVLNLIGMLLARPICKFVGMTCFKVLGWVFAVLQAGLATEGIIYSLRDLGVIQPGP